MAQFYMQRAKRKLRFGIAGLLLLFSVVIGESILKRSETHPAKDGGASLAAESEQRKDTFKQTPQEQIPVSAWSFGNQWNTVFFTCINLVRPNVFKESSFAKTVTEEKADRPDFFGSTDGPDFLKFIDIDGSTGGVVR